MPLLWFLNAFTFSENITWGWWCFTVLAMSKNKVPLESSNPFFNPALENGWQGNPANKISKFGISFSSILVIQPIEELRGTIAAFAKPVWEERFVD